MKLQLLNDIMTFIKVIDNNSFTGAAKELGISKSVVSKHISRLEKTLNAQLLHRSTRRLTPTEGGRAIYENCSRISDDLDEAERAVSYTHSAPRGNLRLNAPISFSRIHLTPALAEFNKLYPEVHVEMLLGMQYKDMLYNGIDVAVKIGKLPDSNFIARKMAQRGLRCCASPEYLKKHGVPKTPQDLLKHNCLRHLSAPTGDEWHFENSKGPIRLKVSGTMSANSNQALEAAAVAGLGITMLPGYMMTQDVKQGKLETFLEEFCPNDLGVYMVYPHTRHLAPKVRAFIDFMAKRFGEEDYWFKC